jgi:MoaA/NifB/PqqE/SkfB family radical SAM enzyme
LDWSTFDRIITEAKTLWGVRFLVISGGEPLAYQSEGKGLLDAAEKHPDVLFMFYTNGTLIDEKTAQRMAALGNVTPAISVEGWRDRTDERRGSGVFDQILAAMEQLRKAGVFFGISLTATRHNAEEILSEEFIDYFFEQQGAFYGWIFQYMPIGRSYTLDLMPTPEQRLWMWKRSWEIVNFPGRLLESRHTLQGMYRWWPCAWRRLHVYRLEWSCFTLCFCALLSCQCKGYLCTGWHIERYLGKSLLCRHPRLAGKLSSKQR